MKPFLKKYVRNIRLGSTITVSVAHVFDKGYWNNYTQHRYKVEYFTKYQIVGRNIEDEKELITIRRNDLDECYMMIIEVQNPEPSVATGA